VEKKVQVLVATDIAARGIDVPDLVWVLNYGLPKTGIYYLHRCGRVARGGRRGIVYNLVAGHDAKMIGMINEAIRNQRHLNLDIIPEEKMKAEKQVMPKKTEPKQAAFRGKEAPKQSGRRSRSEEPQRPKRNRGIRRR
jgi:superfamily II DNA/RNA helicase